MKVKADLDREVGSLLVNCSECVLDVHRVKGVGVSPRCWAHAESAPHGEPIV